MRFEKLRISVGIALVLFILIVGNIIVFGLLNNPNSSQISKTQPDLSTPAFTDNKNAVVNTNTVSTTQNNQQTTPDQTAPVQTPPVYNNFRTRAS